MVKENTQHLTSAIKAAKKKQSPCLLCATMCCSQHSSPAFAKESVTLCLECVQTVERNTYASATLPADLQAQVSRLVDLYQRALGLLQFCAPYMLSTAQELQAQTKQHNEIAGVGGSSVGLASGLLGVAAACTSTCFLGIGFFSRQSLV